VPAVFTHLHVHYQLEGDLDPDKVRRAIDLSLEKYCSVSRMLEKTADISYSFSVNGTEYDG
jgi:putative redox protein